MIVLKSDRLLVEIDEPGEGRNNTVRFDRAGYITRVQLDGQHEFCTVEPDNLSHPCSGGAGLCSEIKNTLWAETPVGGKSPKFGIGLLTKPDEGHYLFYGKYETEHFPMYIESDGRTAVFTNLTQDHLDYHETMENYYQAKKMLFSICDAAVINTDDEYGRRLYAETECEKYSFSVKDKADNYADDIVIKSTGCSFRLNTPVGSFNVQSRIPGMFNVSNLTAAIAVCLREEIPAADILAAIAGYNGVKGRCEVIPTGRDFTVICDYAHTPDAIENILRSVKEYTDNRLICLFGCGGNRDAAKRPKMAKAAAQYADKLVITSDNPRNEQPEAIINDILAGLEDSKTPYDVVVDRREAIYHALKIAEKGDIIVLAGKGHEDYQVLAGMEHIHFDEREIVAEGLKLL